MTRNDILDWFCRRKYMGMTCDKCKGKIPMCNAKADLSQMIAELIQTETSKKKKTAIDFMGRKPDDEDIIQKLANEKAAELPDPVNIMKFETAELQGLALRFNDLIKYLKAKEAGK